MSSLLFPEIEFWLLILFSIVLPILIYRLLMTRRAIAPDTVALFGLALVGIAGIDVFLLQRLSTRIRASLPQTSDVLFVDAVSVALYLLPALFGGIGINLVSHVLVQHLARAERRFRGGSNRL